MARGKTLGEVVTSVRLEAGLDPSPALSVPVTEKIKHKIRREQQTLADEYRWPFLHIERDIRLQAGSRYYDIPSDMDLERLSFIQVHWSGDFVPMTRGISMLDYNAYNSDKDERHEPAMKWDVVFTGQTEQLEIWPLPLTDSTFARVHGYKKLNNLVSDSDRLDLDDILVSLYVAAEITLDPNKAQELRLKAQARLNNLKGRATTDRPHSFGFGGPRTVVQDTSPRVAYVKRD